ncbi:MAG: hypothetical protein ACREA9_14350 [Pyrinomonadaceae bacterium]
MRKFCKLTFALGVLLLLSVSLPEEVCGQEGEGVPGLVFLGPRWGVRIGEHSFGVHTEVEYRLQEVPLTRGHTGRINAIAINPDNRLEILVTSESGGLFKSTTGGTRWRHIDELPLHETRDVAYLPGKLASPDNRIVFVTTFDDFRAPSGAGVWRLFADRWEQPPTSVLPVGGRCASRASGFGIAIEPVTNRIYVATSCGILKSSDDGATWGRIDRPRRGREVDWPSAAFYAVVALGDGKVIAAGRAGVWYSEDGGEIWERSAFPSAGESLNKEEGFHALSASPVSRDQAYVVTGTDGAYKLFYTTNAGRSWDQIPSPAGVGWAGGNPFVKVSLVPGSGDIDIYFGEGIELHKLRALRRPSPTPSFDYVTRPCFAPPDCFAPTACQGGWRIYYLAEDRDHGDVRDVALQDGFQLFLANDGGLEKWNAAERCPRFHSIGGGSGGLNAWQLNSVTGQRIASALGQHIYVGSHDNGIPASADYGFSWPANGGAEGATIQMERQVGRVSDSVVTWTDNGGHGGRLIGGALFADQRVWPAPTDSATGARIAMNGDPILLTRGVYMQYGRALGTTFEAWLTKTTGASWELPLLLPYQPTDNFGIAGPPDKPTLYQPTIRAADGAGNEIVWLTKLTEILTGPLRSEPDMVNFGGLGLNQTWERSNNFPFAVDPGNPDHLIAPDGIRGGMKESIDGGDNWVEMPALTGLVTHGGALRFSRPIGFSESNSLSGLWLTLVSEISFCPDYPDYVLIGTHEGGLYYSQDRGTDGTWIKIPNSDQVKPVSGFYWESPTSVYISTHGRGLWHLRIGARTTIDPGDFETIEWCPLPCFLDDLTLGRPRDPRPIDPSDRRPKDIDEAMLILDGSINDAVIKKGVLKSFAVSPGAMAFSFVSRQTKRSNLLPTYTNRIGQFVGLPRAAELIRQQKIIRGLTFKNGVVKHVVYGDTIVKLETSPQNPSKMKPPKTPVVDDRPYISVVGKKMSGGFPVLHGPGQLEVFGRNFGTDRNKPIEIRVDDKVVAQGIVTDQQGHFGATIKVNAGMGLHGIRVSQRLATGKTLQDARTFVVRPLDR